MGYFPFFVDLAGKKGLIIGGGAMALGKIRRLLPYGPQLTVVSPTFLPELRALSELTLTEGLFSPEMLDGKFFAVAATGDHALNSRAGALCRERGVLFNAVDDRALCSFLFPALIREGSLSVGISTGGASPAAAVYLKRRFRETLPEDFGGMLAYLGGLRDNIKAAAAEEKTRAAVFGRLFEACMEEGWPLPDEALAKIIDDCSPVPDGSELLP